MCDAAPVPAAAAFWAESLVEWTVPPEILERAPESPWAFPVPLFERAAQRAVHGEAGPSRRRALEALPVDGSVLDVGTGAGAAALPLAPPAALLVGVDQSPEMLAAFSEAASRRGAAACTIEGRWPDVAPEAPVVDVVTCHHVFYNVADLVPFAAALTDHATGRVVVELTAAHPQSSLNRLWRALHGLERPTRPTADDAVAVLEEMGLDVGREDSERGPLWHHHDTADMVAFTRRRLCVGPERDTEISELLGSPTDQPPRRLVTLWWAGGAPAG